MAKPIPEAINQRIISEYSLGKISKPKLALKLGVSQSHVCRIIKRSRSDNFQRQPDLAVLENLKDSEAQSARM